MRVLGIESSCDDTGVGVIEKGNIIENVLVGQEHFGGVIPEYAARFHHLAIYNAVKPLFNNIDLIAYTNGPGLMGSLFVGSSFAKGLAYASGVKSIAINHIEAHMMLPYWVYKFKFPFLALIISGGHTLLAFVEEVGKFQILAKSIDDAVGEVLDKIARHIGLGYPGGKLIEDLAKESKGFYKFNFPFPMLNSDNFSFSGLKTAAINQIAKDAKGEEKADFCAQLQVHIANILVLKLEKWQKKLNVKNLVVSGGVASNKVIREKMEDLAFCLNCELFLPDLNLCGDNGVMIAALGELRFPMFGSSSFQLKPFASFI